MAEDTSGTSGTRPERGAAKRSTTKKSPTKKSSTKTSSTKTSSTKTSPVKKSPRKKSSAEESSSNSSGSENSGQQSRGRSAAKAEARPAARASQVAAQAASELLELTGKAAEGVTGLERTEDGWTVEVEVVEVRRVPDTTDVLALYEVQTDRQGALQGYRRLQRYARGSAGDSR